MNIKTILDKLRSKHAKGIDPITLSAFCRTLSRLFGPPIHTHYGNFYLLKEII